MWLVLLALASADPDRPIPRETDRLRVGTWATVEGEGPALARWRRRSGPIRAWTWRDRSVEHYLRSEDGAVVEGVWFNAAGDLIGTASWDSGAPTEFTALWPHSPSVDLSTWVEVTQAGLMLRAPSAQGPWPVDQGTVELALWEELDAFAPELGAQIETGCSCDVVDRNPGWVDGRPAVRFRLDLLDARGPMVGEVWVIPTQEQTLTLWATWRTGERTALSTLRAMVSLAAWEDT